MVAKGVGRGGGVIEVIVDRREAIRSAVARLEPGDVLLVAGKGHEDYQEVHGLRTPFDDCVELEEAVQCLV
jgi:UDP-N-acetylmuramoyl-L-alanyl-D-glutamate--2,6-diaminopimelate ligase